MPLVPMKELLIKAYKEGYAVPSFCVWSAETIQKVIEVAEKLKALEGVSDVLTATVGGAAYWVDA